MSPAYKGVLLPEHACKSYLDGEKMETVTDFISLAPESLWTVTAAMKLKMLASWKKSYDKSRHHIKQQRHHFANKGPSC